jgi:hypothetical protein
VPGEGRIAAGEDRLAPGAEQGLRDIEATESFWSVIIFTAASLNSAVYVVRGRAIGELLGLSLHR